MKTSRIKEVVSVKPYESANGTIHYHNLVLENGDKINIGKKNQQEIGWKVTYEIVDTSQEFNKAKPRQEEQSSFTGRKQYPPKGNDDARQRLIVLQSCAKVASEQYMNRGQFGTPEDIATYAIELADKLMKG